MTGPGRSTSPLLQGGSPKLPLNTGNCTCGAYENQEVLRRKFHLPIFFHLQRLVSCCWRGCLVFFSLRIFICTIVVFVVTILINRVIVEGFRRSSCVRFFAITGLCFRTRCGFRSCSWFCSYWRARLRLIGIFVAVITVTILVQLSDIAFLQRRRTHRSAKRSSSISSGSAILTAASREG